ncbi:MAG: DUF1588 domain-containing protein [Deltaproteobacteria bacterium]|nr:DUF1588 domain-containing protein [Deltaproteobacteria bacterium]
MHLFVVRKVMPSTAFAIAVVFAACSGAVVENKREDDEVKGEAGRPGQPGKTPEDSLEESRNWDPEPACDAAVQRKVLRLSDRQIRHAMRDLLGVAMPALETGPGNQNTFIAPTAATVTAAVFDKLQRTSETVAREATVAGSDRTVCKKTNEECAASFIDDFAGRAFRRPLMASERSELLAVYKTGVQQDQRHADGLSLVIEAVLQSPSFLYQIEQVKDGGLTDHELAARLGWFLLDSVPDNDLWQAAQRGALSDAGTLQAQTSRLLELPQVKAHLVGMFTRMLGLEALADLTPEDRDGLTAKLLRAMQDEATTMIQSELWNQGSLEGLLTTQSIDARDGLGELYGVAEGAPATLPADQRAGILTRAGMMTLHAEEHQTSVVFRGLAVARNLLCIDPPAPSADEVGQGQILAMEIPTERGRAEARTSMPTCRGCHLQFDPVGVAFEHYDSLGRYRDTLEVEGKKLAVDASWDVDVADITGRTNGAVELSQRLAKSQAVRHCVTANVASFALGRRLADDEICAVRKVADAFAAQGGDMRSLVLAIATWPGLHARKGK